MPSGLNCCVERLEDESFFLMANLVQEHTGLPFIIWITPRMNICDPVIKVQGDNSKKLNKDLLFAVTISDKPQIIGRTGLLSQEDLEAVRRFVKLNIAVLLDYWNEVDPDIASIISKLKKA